jgi:predicted lipoprotein with Yx(FWY)xxD motif
MRSVRNIVFVLTTAALVAVAGTAARAESHEQKASTAAVEDYMHVPMPPGFHVEATELNGPVFADSHGRTLYRWPLKALRNGNAGEQKGIPTCDNQRYTENAGLMSPYPAGLILPEVDKRPSCVDMWPPVLASKDAKPVGKWTIVNRKGDQKQWAFDGYALYTSSFDHRAGDVLGGRGLRGGGDMPAVRQPVGPPSNIPPGFAVSTVETGRLLLTDKNFSVYAFDKDTATKSNCDAQCAQAWSPVLAPASAHAQGDWSIIERSPGVGQWAFRKSPLYTHIADRRVRSFEGSDVPGWRNVYTQAAPPAPKGFTVHDTTAGQVLADARGMTVYLYNCGDDALDQLACDHPDTPQEYRMAICGGGDPAKCLVNWPYVIAPKDARSDSRVWSVMDIDPKTGHRATPGQADALHVWAFRDRPVYTFAGDPQPGDTRGDGVGEWRGQRNGFKAFWLRDDFFNGAG